MAAQQDYKFEGWVGYDESAAEGKMVWGAYDPKPWEETDVDIKISHCGICGSDLHKLRSGWVIMFLMISSSLFTGRLPPWRSVLTTTCVLLFN